MIRVGLNLLSVDPQGGGVTTYAVELVRALAARDDLALDVFASDDVHAVLAQRIGPGLPPVHEGPRRTSRARYTAALFAAVPLRARRLGVDLLHSVANFGPAHAFGIPCVATVHDVIWAQVGAEWGTPMEVRQISALSRATVPRMRRVMTDSEASRTAIIDILGVDPTRIDVVPLGVTTAADGGHMAADAIRRRFGLGDAPIVLCVAQKRRYKGHAALIRACAALDAPVELVLPGAPTPYEAELRDLARSSGIGDRVHFPAWVEPDELEALYAVATCVVLPSTIEGFGFPALEAMVRGVPVACSSIGALAEVTTGAAMHFDPGDPDAIAACIRRLLSDDAQRTALVEAGRSRAADYTWERTAAETVAVYRRAIGC